MVGFYFQPEGKILGIVMGRARLPKRGSLSVEGDAFGDVNTSQVTSQ